MTRRHSTRSRIATAPARLLATLPSRRLVGAVAATFVNVIILATLYSGSSSGWNAHERDNPDAISIVFVKHPVVQRLADEPQPKRHHKTPRPSTAVANNPPNLLGPPTETVASVAATTDDEPVQQELDTKTLYRLCADTRESAQSSRGDPMTVRLRVFVMADGRISQGTIAESSGDEAFDHALFRCIQAYANLAPKIEDGSPVGSWQAVTAEWGRQ